MKRTIHLIISLFLMLLFSQACKKTPIRSSESANQELIESARSFFESHVQNSTPATNGNNRTKASKQPYWKAAYTINSSKGPLVIIPVFYQKDLVVKTNFSGSRLYSLNYLTKLVMYKDATGFYSELITGFPDSTNQSSNDNQFTGLVFTESWNGSPLKKYKMSGGITLTETNPSSGNGVVKSTTSAGKKEINSILETCTTIYGFNYSDGDGGDAYFWSESGGCSYSFLPDAPGGSGAPFGDLSNIFRRPNLPPILMIAPPTNVIGNVQDYMKCFSNYGGSDHTYQVMVCVDQPNPGTRDPWNLNSDGIPGSSSGSNPVDAGHVFLVLSENFSDHSIVRNVGFYPQTKVFPWSSSAQGQLNDDDGHTYNISLTVTVDNGQFFNILNYISQGNNAGYMYDLNTNNCTSFAIRALGAGNVSIPATVGSWPDGGFGYDPGDLGEDIRNMPISSNMSKNTTYNDHPNKYNCN
jgi:hypothetical protein